MTVSASTSGGPGRSRNGKRELEGESSSEASPVDCRRAFAFHSDKVSKSFHDMGYFSADGGDDDVTWGWSNGPLATSNYAYSFELYADTLQVGSVTVTYQDDEAAVTIDAGEQLWLKNVHAHVGHNRLPLAEDGSTEIIDPSLFPVVHDRMSMSRSFTVGDLEDGHPIYVVAEATVCGMFPTRESQEAEQPVGGLGKVAGFFKKLF